MKKSENNKFAHKRQQEIVRAFENKNGIARNRDQKQIKLFWPSDEYLGYKSAIEVRRMFFVHFLENNSVLFKKFSRTIWSCECSEIIV